jgi:hypothetical protein
MRTWPKFAAVFLVLAASFAIPACSDGTSSNISQTKAPTSPDPRAPTTTPDASASETGTSANDAGNEPDVLDAATTPDTSTPDAGRTCNAIKQLGPAVHPTQASGRAPSGTGGVLEKGTYVLKESVYYNIIFGDLAARQTIVIADGELQGITGDDYRYPRTLVVSGNSLTQTPTLPSGENPLTYTFTATPDELTLYSGPNQGTAVVLRFERLPAL